MTASPNAFHHDGHVIRLGSDPKTDRPFAEWVVWYPVHEDE